jgi:hypothetical protein
VHAPLHPENVEFGEGVAVSVICVPGAKPALHVEPQLMPFGALVTDPEPVPLNWTVRAGFEVKLAVRVLLEFSVTVQAAIPLQAPPHPEK